MNEMMERLGIEAVAALRHGEAFIRARANCRSCHCVGACQQWFLEEPEGTAESCPNFGFFNRLKSS
jgi:hypothetical protein